MAKVTETKATPAQGAQTPAQGAPKLNKAIDTAIEGSVLVIRTHEGNLSIDASKLTPEIQQAAVMHGLKQKIVDAAAIGRNPENGRSATIKDKYDAMKEVIDRLTTEAQWNKTRAGGAGGSDGLLVRALVELYPSKTLEYIREFVGGKDKKEQAALRANPKVAAIIDRLRAESSDIDTEALLDELE